MALIAFVFIIKTKNTNQTETETEIGILSNKPLNSKTGIALDRLRTRTRTRSRMHAHIRALTLADEPLTVFVPSNEALRKIPDEELEVIKNNSTALRGEYNERPGARSMIGLGPKVTHRF